MAVLNFSTKLLRLTETTLTTVKCCVKIQKDCSDTPLKHGRGLDKETYYQLCFSMSYLKRYNYEQNYKRRAPNKQTRIFAYADEIDIVGRSLEVIRDVFLALEAETVQIGMKINEQKTKYMIAAGNRTILNNEQTVAFGDKNFEVVNEFLNLEALLTYKNVMGLEIQQRFQTANRCFCGQRKYLRSSHRCLIQS
jgi:hypothetical protein